jgi:hypothetical protein
LLFDNGVDGFFVFCGRQFKGHKLYIYVKSPTREEKNGIG